MPHPHLTLPRALVLTGALLVAGTPAALAVKPTDELPKPTRSGTERADRMTGTNKRDVFFGLDGADYLRGRGGNDRLYGGSGNDRVEGGPGNDLVEGGSGRDRLVGGSGRDELDGGSGNDRIEARDGAVDKIHCGSGRDTVIADRKDTTFSCEVVYRR